MKNEEVILGIRPENITASETDGIAELFPNSRCEIEADVVELLGHELIVYGFLNSQKNNFLKHLQIMIFKFVIN